MTGAKLALAGIVLCVCAGGAALTFVRLQSAKPTLVSVNYTDSEARQSAHVRVQPLPEPTASSAHMLKPRQMTDTVAENNLQQRSYEAIATGDIMPNVAPVPAHIAAIHKPAEAQQAVLDPKPEPTPALVQMATLAQTESQSAPRQAQVSQIAPPIQAREQEVASNTQEPAGSSATIKIPRRPTS